MKEQLEDIVKVSSKGQIVIPKDMRKKLGVKTGEKLLVLSRGSEILLRKAQETSIEEIAKKVEDETKENCINIDELLDEAIEWARKSK
jgi:antitoxin PrlF